MEDLVAARLLFPSGLSCLSGNRLFLCSRQFLCPRLAALKATQSPQCNSGGILFRLGFLRLGIRHHGIQHFTCELLVVGLLLCGSLLCHTGSVAQWGLLVQSSICEGVMGYYRWNYSCPSCGKIIHMRASLSVRKCPFCGEPVTPAEIRRQKGRQGILAVILFVAAALMLLWLNHIRYH